MVGVLKQMEQYGHEQVVFAQDNQSGLKAIIGIHSTALGPTLGGCRMWNYATEDEALYDVLRLSMGMTYKAAVAGLNLGGGKGVIIGDSKTQKTPELLKAFGRAVESLDGRYITTEDVGIRVPDIDIVKTQTRFAVGGSYEGGAGNPSPTTAFGVFQGIKATLEFAGYGKDLKGIRVAIQGIGNVGYYLAEHLHKAGAQLLVADLDAKLLEKVKKEFGAQIVPIDKIYSIDCDIFAPCALGAILNSKTIPQLKCKIIAGAANNQLETESDGMLLFEQGFIYIPDFAINSGGLIHVASELDGYNQQKVLDKAAKIYDTIASILQLSKQKSIPPYIAANHLAESRLKAGKLSPTPS